jgi:hypothetical protein
VFLESKVVKSLLWKMGFGAFSYRGFRISLVFLVCFTGKMNAMFLLMGLTNSTIVIK